MNLTLMDETTKALPITILHLKPNTVKFLNENGVRSISQLSELLYTDFDGLIGTSVTVIKDVLRVMNSFSQSLNSNGRVDWFKFWMSLDIIILPINYRPNSTPEQIIEYLPNLFKEIFLTENEADKKWRTIQRRFGLENTQRLTLDEIGQAFGGITRERVRQIEDAAISELQDVLLENKYDGKKYHVNPEIINFIRSLFDAVANDAKGFVLETELLIQIQNVVNINLKPQHFPTLFLLFHLFGLNRVNIETYESTPIWEYGKTEQRKVLEKVIKLIDDLLTRQTPVPMDEFDLLSKINSKLNKSHKIDALQLHRFLKLCGSVEKRSDGLFQGKFEFLKSRSNQAERILLEANEPLHIEEIARRFNNRLVVKGKKKVDLRNIANIMSTDGRFNPIGSSGLRGLKAWENFESGNILDLMEEFLISVNRPATEDEIYEYVLSRRPVKMGSIKIYLASKDIFRKAGLKKWGLATWSKTQNALIWSPKQVADFVANIFKERKTRELEFKIITQTLMKAANINSNQARGLLIKNPVVVSRREENPFKIVAVFNPNYNTELAPSNLRVYRRAETKFQKAQKVVREMLEAEPTKQVELSKLVGELRSRHNFHEKTAYQYISKMDFLEKVDLPETGTRICRFKGKKAFSFPQISKLNSLDIAKADEASKAIDKLTLEEVDIGLFMLGRLFENTLKDFMIMAETSKAYSIKPTNYEKLNNMIQWVESNGIVSDKTALNLLRLERNDRAHGIAPKLEQREMMLKSAPWMVSLYLDYIVFFCNEKNKL